MGADMKIRLKHLVEDRDRHGNMRYYLRVPGMPKVRIRSAISTDAFLDEYKTALDAIAAGPAEPTGRAEKAEPPPKPGTFRYLCTEYMGSAEFKQLATKTKAARRGIIEHMWDEPIRPGAKERFRDFPINRMTPRAVVVLRDRKADLPEAANSRLKVLRRMFRWACSPGVDLMTTNIAREIPKLRPKRPDGFHAWTEAEVNQYRERHPIGTRARLAMELMLLTAQRRSDMVGMGRQHVRNGWIHFTQVKGSGTHPKRMALPIHPELQAAIDLLPKDSLAFLMTEQGRPFTANGFGNWFRDRCDEAGLPQCSAHGLRKRALEDLAERGATDRELMAVGGHESAKEVDRYTKAAQQKRMAARAMAKWLQPTDELADENEN